jgi:signal transduction histidine kinase
MGVSAIFSKVREKLWFLRSMRVQSIAIVFLVGIIPIVSVSWSLIQTYNQKAVSQRISELQRQGNSLANLLQSTGYLTNKDIPEVNSEISQIAGIYEGRIIIVNNSLNIVKDTYGLEEGNTLIAEVVIKTLRGTNAPFHNKNRNYIEMTIPITHDKEVMGVIVMIFSTKNIVAISDMLSQKTVVLFITMAILIFVFAFFYSAVLTKPLKRLRGAIEHLTEGYMDEEVSISGFYETDLISNSLNQMLLRMKNLEKSRQEFVSNVSHELKTPLTSVKVLADSLLMQENVAPELYREFLVDIAEEIERESKIINDLLSLVKLDKTASDMNITSTNINDLLESVLKRLRPIAKKRNIELVFESFRPVVAEVDEVKLSLAISNLIENAIKYNVEDGWVRVSLNADHKYFYVKVADSGIGIPEDAQDFIFDRFYRVDKARSRGTGGTGLGLSITKNAIHMHKGAIKVYSKENEGTTFTVRVPINYIA